VPVLTTAGSGATITYVPRRSPSPGAVLRENGFATWNAAKLIGTSESMMTQILRGNAPCGRDVEAGLVRLLGYTEAGRVLDAIPRRRRSSDAQID
jgi:hypothetical protein